MSPQPWSLAPSPACGERISTLIADDEPIAREGLRVMLSAFPQILIVGEARDGIEAARAMRQLRPQLAFIDVQMPEADAFTVLHDLPPAALPMVVIVTAYEEYALSAFDANAVDYLLKPFTRKRLEQTLYRVARFAGRDVTGGGAARSVTAATSPPAPHAPFVVRDRGRIELIPPDDIDWIESWGNYVRIFMGSRSLLVRESMTAVDAKLEGTGFLRISRSAIVNTRRVRSLVSQANGQVQLLLADGHVLLASRRTRERLLHFFQLA